jgi:predicted ATP-grasp superfamily ATP-dependent carboligase
VHWVNRNLETLSHHFFIRWPSQTTFDLMMSKIEFQRLALQENWPVPVTLSIKDRSALLSQLGEVPYPCILKPAIKSSAYLKHSPAKAFILSSEKQLLEHYDLVAQWDREVVIQEWIGGDDHRIAYCLAYYDENSRPQAMFIGRKLRQCPIDCGNTAVAAPSPEHWVGPLMSLSKEIFARLQYRGIGSIEFKMRTDGSPVIMEPTVGRTNWQSEIAVLNGVDIPSVAYFDLIGASQLPIDRDVAPCKLVHGRMHFRAMMQQRRAGRLLMRGWLRERRGNKRYMLWRVNDPVPFLASASRRAWRALTRIPDKLLRKLLPRTA